MALFKILRGSSSELTNLPINDGYCYFTPDTGLFHIDYNENRVPLNANGLIDQNTGELIKIWHGTTAEYENLEEKDDNTIYVLTDEVGGSITADSVEYYNGISGLNAENVQDAINEIVVNSKAYTDEAIAKIPTPDVSGQIGSHNTNSSAHSDIRAAISAHTSDTNNPHGVTAEQLGLDGAISLIEIDNGIVELPSSESWYSITYGNGRFVAVVDGATTVAYSDDDINWTTATMPSAAHWSYVTYGNGRFVAVAQASFNIAYSDDGINWNMATLTSSQTFYSVTYGNGRFVAMAHYNNMAIYSDDGINWSVATLPTTAQWQSVTYGNGLFVAVAKRTATVVYSEDGINWSTTTLPKSASWNLITYGNGRFVAVAQASSEFACSDDGINWTTANMPSATSWTSATYGNDKFVMVTYDSNKAVYSDDGISWVSTTLPSSAYWQSVTYGNGKFVAVAYDSNKIAISYDGISWTNISTTTALTDSTGNDITESVKALVAPDLTQYYTKSEVDAAIAAAIEAAFANIARAEEVSF